ncbi:MAG: hypothetical protein ACI4SR_06580 [Faecalibacillus sp.]
MDDIIQKLVEFDRQCVEKVEVAKQKRNDAQSNMTEKKTAIYNEYIKNQQSQIEKHKQELMDKNNKEARLQEEKFNASMKKMEDLYNQNKDKWVQEIVSNCIK